MKIRVYIPMGWVREEDKLAKSNGRGIWFWEFPTYWNFTCHKFRVVYDFGLSIKGYCDSLGMVILPHDIGTLRVLYEIKSDDPDVIAFKPIPEVKKMEMIAKEDTKL